MNDQLTLDVFLRTDKHFENFVTGENSLLVKNLKESENDGFFIWGKKGAGKSHLLNAVSCLKQKQFQDKSVVLLPLSSDESFPPEILQGLESCALVCIDDIDVVMNDEAWEQALFHLINRMKDTESILLVSSSLPLANLPIKLVDLKTRLGQLLNYELLPLSDSGRREALQQHAYEKGMRLEQEVLNYIMLRGPRNMTDLMAFLELVEKASLKERRQVTIPFIKQVVDW